MPETAAPPSGLVVAIVGAESTGKSCLSLALQERIRQLTGLHCEAVPEYLRQWCDERQRTPQAHEQAHIAAEQARRILAASQRASLVLADTTPLMTAVYHHTVFASTELDAFACAWQRQHCATSLLTALDLPWQADGLQRDGPHVRLPVDARLRELLIHGGLPFTVVAGEGEQRVEAALDALSPWLRQLMPTRSQGLFSRLAEREAAQPTWRQLCTDCDDPGCEHAAWALRQAN
jgi:nicotinamide riboside kinase